MSEKLPELMMNINTLEFKLKNIEFDDMVMFKLKEKYVGNSDGVVDMDKMYNSFLTYFNDLRGYSEILSPIIEEINSQENELLSKDISIDNLKEKYISKIHKGKNFDKLKKLNKIYSKYLTELKKLY